MKRLILTVIAVFIIVFPVLGQANGKLQIHYGNVWQADSAVLISPQGEVVLFDNGDFRTCKTTLAYLAKAKIKKIDYMIISHYHADHFGCTREVLAKHQLKKTSFDRGEPFPSLKNDKGNPSMFAKYLKAVGSKRKAVTNSTTIVLDKASDHPVRINIAAFNGAGVSGADDENDRSIAAVIHFGQFDVMMAGDLSGEDTHRYKDVETTVSNRVGQVEVYKVNHHGSEHSSNNVWMTRLSPRIAVVSAGNGNTHGHPTREALDRIEDADVERIYWTERGKGAKPKAGRDVVVKGVIRVEIAPGATKFTVRYGANKDTYSVWSTPYSGAR